MREILFRGKRIDNGEWVEGYYLVAAGMAFISAFGIREPIQVDGETVGQYTGLTDKNGIRVFEGDIVKQTFLKTVVIASDDIWDADEYADLYGEDVGGVVILPSKGACIKNPVIHREIDCEITQDREVAKMYKNICSGRCEVIGNIHDNPELLEVSNNE